MYVKNFIFAILLCIIPTLVEAQTFTYSYSDPCTGMLKTINVPTNGVTVTYFGQINTFSPADFNNGVFNNWADNVYSSFGGNNPCGSTIGITSTISMAQNTAMNVLGILNTLDAISSMSGGGMNTNGVTESSKTSSKKSDKKNNKNNQSSSNGTISTNGSTTNSTSGSNGDNGTTSSGSTVISNGSNGTTSTNGSSTQSSNGTSTNGSSTNSNGATSGPSSTNSQSGSTAGGVSGTNGSSSTGTTNGSSTNNTNSTNGSTTTNGSSSTNGPNTTNSTNPTGSNNGTSTNNTESGSNTTSNGSSTSGSETTGSGTTSGTTGPGTTSGTTGSGTTTGTGGVTSNGGSGSGTPPNNNSNGTDAATNEEKKSSNVLGGSIGSIQNSTSGGSKSGNKEGGKPSIVLSSDFAGFNFKQGDVSYGGKGTAGWTSLNWDGTRSHGFMLDYTTANKGPNLTAFYALIKKRRIDLLSLTATTSFYGKGSLYGTVAIGQMWSFPKVKNLKAIYMATSSMGNVFGTKFIGTAFIAGGMYDMKMGKRTQIKFTNLFIYAPYISYYNDMVLKSPYVIMPIIGTNIGVTKKFKLNVNLGGTYAIGENVLNFTFMMGTRLAL